MRNYSCFELKKKTHTGEDSLTLPISAGSSELDPNPTWARKTRALSSISPEESCEVVEPTGAFPGSKPTCCRNFRSLSMKYSAEFSSVVLP